MVAQCRHTLASQFQLLRQAIKKCLTALSVGADSVQAPRLHFPGIEIGLTFSGASIPPSIVAPLRLLELSRL